MMKKIKWVSTIAITLACLLLGSACNLTKPEEEEEENYEVEILSPEVIEFNKDITITEDGNVAQVLANEGLSYSATGYSQIIGNAFEINKGFTIEFSASELTDSAFNRFSIGYTSTQPLRGTISYTEKEKIRNDTFFLEAGEHTFSCLTNGYLNGNKAEKITSITFESCTDQPATFALCLLKTYDYTIYASASEVTYYMENKRLKLGIHLAWGGGINYLYDKKNRKQINGNNVENLINQHDTGRLVQQSYYGGKGDENYKPGIYMNTKWSYNPVQGGDQFNNHSRLIDVIVNEYSVYIKTQPLDWAKYYSYTPSYMENVYTLMKDHVRVDNRFIDFSGMDHPHSTQEIPAFYTLSCFDRFSWYDGTKSWTDDVISHRDNLKFWGLAENSGECIFKMKESNEETWCAWTNSKSNYGIGLYVPNIDEYFAGRYQYNGSTDANAGATNYVAMLKTIKLTPYTPIEYSYLLTTGSLQNIRSVFKENKDFAENLSLDNNSKDNRLPDKWTLDFSNESEMSRVIATNDAAAAFDSAENALKLTVNGNDPYAQLKFSIIANNYKKLNLTYMIPKDNAKGKYQCDMFICAHNVTTPTEDCCVRANLTKDGEYHTLTIDFTKYEWWKGDLRDIRFDFFNEAGIGDCMYVKSIQLE